MRLMSSPCLTPPAGGSDFERQSESTLPVRATIERTRRSCSAAIIDGVQRLSGPLLALHRAGDIEARHVSAADRWYRDYVLGVAGARDPDARRAGNAPDIHVAMLSRVAACGRYRAVRDELGTCAEVRLQLLLVDELSFSAIAEKLMPSDGNGRKKIAAQMIFLLEQLSEHYERLDQGARANRSNGTRASAYSKPVIATEIRSA